MRDFIKFQEKLRKCRICKDVVGPPLVWGDKKVKIVQISQAPSQAAIKTQKVWNDTAGKRLKYQWYQITDEVFNNPKNFYITAIAHCFPGKDKKGADKKPPLICAQTWLHQELSFLNPKIFVAIGKQAAKFLFSGENYRQLIFQDQIFNDAKCLVLPHPSSANIKWFKDNPNFEEKRLPEIRRKIHQALGIR